MTTRLKKIEERRERELSFFRRQQREMEKFMEWFTNDRSFKLLQEVQDFTGSYEERKNKGRRFNVVYDRYSDFLTDSAGRFIEYHLMQLEINPDEVLLYEQNNELALSLLFNFKRLFRIFGLSFCKKSFKHAMKPYFTTKRINEWLK